MPLKNKTKNKTKNNKKEDKKKKIKKNLIKAAKITTAIGAAALFGKLTNDLLFQKVKKDIISDIKSIEKI